MGRRTIREELNALERSHETLNSLATLLSGLFLLVAGSLFVYVLTARDATPAWVAPAGELAVAVALGRIALLQHVNARMEQSLERTRKRLDELEQGGIIGPDFTGR